MSSLSLFAQEPEYNRSFDEDFKSRYEGRKYNYEGDAEVKRELTLNDGEFAEYENTTPREREENNSTFGGFTGGLLNWVFIIILVLAVVFVMYNIMSDGETGLFSRKKFRKIQTKEINGSNIEETDIESLISSAEKEQDFRLAVRYYYLLVLKTLSLKNVIKYEDDKTDTDYLNEIGTQTYNNSFAKTAYLYNYVWYGEFPLNQQQYGKAKNSFENLLKTVK